MRLQLALNVPDLDAAVALYTKMFATTPHKRRPGYANFAIDNPPLKLVLFEAKGASEHLNHIGVEVMDASTMPVIERRLADAGLLARFEEQAICCHAAQMKFWTHAIAGLCWEWYRITDDDPPAVAETGEKTCCT